MSDNPMLVFILECQLNLLRDLDVNNQITYKWLWDDGLIVWHALCIGWKFSGNYKTKLKEWQFEFDDKNTADQWVVHI